MASYERENQPINEFGGAYDENALTEKLDIQVRHGFVRKVFSIVAAQLLVTTAVCVPFVMHKDEVKLWLVNHMAVYYIAAFTPLAVLIAIMCNPGLAKNYPTNYVMLSLLTLGISFMTGLTCSAFTTSSVLMAVGMTTLVVAGLMCFAMQTKHDFSGMGPYLFIALLVMFFTSLIGFFFWNSIMETIYCSCGVLVFSMYIVYDTQLIVGGKHHAHQFSIDDYVFAAINLYLDIINLFIMMLRLFGNRE